MVHRNTAPLAVATVLATAAAGATEYYVAPSGNDENPGTEAEPFRTIQRAAYTTEAGDVVTVATGIYREQVELFASGLPDSPIRFQAAADGCVIVSGADYLDLDWSVYEGDIWVAATDRYFTQLFADGQAMVDARWPNVEPDDLVNAPFAQDRFRDDPHRVGRHGSASG